MHGPGKRAVKAGDDVNERPSYDYIVIETYDVRRVNRCESYPGKPRIDAPEHRNVSFLELLAQGELHQKKRDAHEEEADQIRRKEVSAIVLVGHVGEPPEVAEAHCSSYGRQNEAWPIQPSLPLIMISPFLIC